MKRKQTKKTVKNPFPLSEIAVFYDAACDHPKATFAQIAKRVVPRGFDKTSAVFKKEARRVFNLAR
jgi:hypothetical protein